MRTCSMGVGASSRHRFSVSWPPANAFQAAGKKAAPALGEHRHEFWRESHQLRRYVYARSAADGQCVASVVAARDGHARGEQGIRQRCSTGATLRMDWRIEAWGKRMPSWRQNEDAQAPPASTAVLVLMTPASVTTPLTPPALQLDAAGRAVLVDAATELHERSCHGRRSLGRIGGAIAGREDAAFPGAAGRLPSLGGLPAIEHVGGHSGGLRKVAPTAPTRQLGLVVTEIQQPAAMKAGVFTGFGGKSLPEIKALGCTWAIRERRGSAGGTSPNCGSIARRRFSPFRPRRLKPRAGPGSRRRRRR